MDGALFQRIRQSLGLTATELGEKLNISKVYVSMIETNRRPVSELQELKIKALLIEALNSSDELFDLIFSLKELRRDFPSNVKGTNESLISLQLQSKK